MSLITTETPVLGQSSTAEYTQSEEESLVQPGESNIRNFSVDVLGKIVENLPDNASRIVFAWDVLKERDLQTLRSDIFFGVYYRPDQSKQETALDEKLSGFLKQQKLLFDPLSRTEKKTESLIQIICQEKIPEHRKVFVLRKLASQPTLIRIAIDMYRKQPSFKLLQFINELIEQKSENLAKDSKLIRSAMAMYAIHPSEEVLQFIIKLMGQEEAKNYAWLPALAREALFPEEPIRELEQAIGAINKEDPTSSSDFKIDYIEGKLQPMFYVFSTDLAFFRSTLPVVHEDIETLVNQLRQIDPDLVMPEIGNNDDPNWERLFNAHRGFALRKSLYARDIVNPQWTQLLAEQDPKSILDQLVTLGANINLQSTYRYTQIHSFYSPLHYAIKYRRTEIAAALINKGADLNIPGQYGFTPLHLAIVNGMIEIALALIKAGADLNIKNNFGTTPFHIAIIHKRTEIATTLINKRADLNIPNEDGNTPLHLAIIKGMPEIAAALINKGADLNIKNNFGDTPLHVAAKYGSTGVIRTLIDGGANPNIQNTGGSTPLHIASCVTLREPQEKVRALIDGGADLNIQNKIGHAPLHEALRTWDNAEVIRALIDAGADLSLRDRRNRTPLLMAYDGEYYKLAAMIAAKAHGRDALIALNNLVGMLAVVGMVGIGTNRYLQSFNREVEEGVPHAAVQVQVY